jgi:hypothetical protein
MVLDVSTWVIAVVAAVLASALAVTGVAGVWARSGRSRSARLRRTFGPEYDATVGSLGRERGEEDLEGRLQRYEGLAFGRVNFQSRDALAVRWAECQYRFVEDPGASLRDAQHLLSRLMQGRGFPLDAGETVRALSVSTPRLAFLYRQATDAFRETDDGEGTIEQQFRAVGLYRRVFEALTSAEPEGRRQRTATGSTTW